MGNTARRASVQVATDTDGALGKSAWASVMEEPPASSPILSLILCSRNDEYMGNSCWRLETTLNYVADQVVAMGRVKDVEVLVADWGSEIPLREVLRLTPAAARIVSFILIPPEIARPLQKDSPFPEVLALNAAARRANGVYIGRIDQDTLVGRRFLQVFFDLYEGKQKLEVPLESALLFSNLRMVPYRLAVHCPSTLMVEQFIERFGRNLKVEITLRAPFYYHGVGIWLLSNVLWRECGGYDEEMLYMNSMEIDMIRRLLQKYAIVNLGRIVDFDFYHLEHYHPWVPRRSSFYRKTNRFNKDAPKGVFHPNNEKWGMVEYPLRAVPYAPPDGAAVTPRRKWRVLDEVIFSLLLLIIRTQTLCDFLSVPCIKLADVGDRWNRQWQKAWTAIRGEHPLKWPRALIKLYEKKRFE
jgi:hypothetical protein